MNEFAPPKPQSVLEIIEEIQEFVDLHLDVARSRADLYEQDNQEGQVIYYRGRQYAFRDVMDFLNTYIPTEL